MRSGQAPLNQWQPSPPEEQQLSHSGAHGSHDASGATLAFNDAKALQMAEDVQFRVDSTSDET